MPFGVTQWPKEPDPRPPQYIVEGWAVGQLSSFKWILSTEDATGDLAVFNSGVRFHNVFFSATTGVFVVDDTLPDDLAVIFNITSSQVVQVGPPTWTVSIDLQLFQLTTLLYSALFRQLFPTAIQVQGPISMTEFDTSAGTITEPMSIEPAKWNS